MSTNIYARQKEFYLWPIEDQKAGTNIICAPQDYLDNELNFDNMFITAPEGTIVVSPVDGTIEYVLICYYMGLSGSEVWSAGEGFDKAIDQVTKDITDKTINTRYLSGSLSIKADDGAKIIISGLTGSEQFKTGQKIKKGTPIGKVGYSYSKIEVPSIRINVLKNGDADPMTPFGLKSSFLPPKKEEEKPIEFLTKEQAKEDFTIYISALKEAYPGLYHVVNPKELDEFEEEILSKIDSYDGDLEFFHFFYIMKDCFAKIHDSHLGLYRPKWPIPIPENIRNNPDMPGGWVGWINDTLICTNATKEYEHLISKQVVSINGLPADSAKSIVASKVDNYDAQVESYKDIQLATTGFSTLFREPYGKNSADMTLSFTDEQVVDVKGAYNGDNINYVFNFKRSRQEKRICKKILNDSTVYLGLSTFGLNQIEVEEVGVFIDSISKADVPHLIVDIRDNGGGHSDVVHKLYSYIAGQPMALDGYHKVNKKGDFDCFKYSTNYKGVKGDIFPDYIQEEGTEGYLSRAESWNTIVPDSVINYKGKIYMLTNENSTSAATLFPALLVRNHRGVTVGRETRGAYHFLTALKFVDIRLPNSTLVVRIPLVALWFDTKVNDRVPFGRGVLPDYEVPISIDELTQKNGDAILNRALKLIEDSEYLKGENPFIELETQAEDNFKLGMTLIVVLLSVIVIIYIIKRIRTKSK